MNRRELMVNCALVNLEYMRLPAGQLGDFREIVKFYERLAAQSLTCAQAWWDDKPCPKHEPALDAFWWAVVSWAEAFLISLGVAPRERWVFVNPHLTFARYLRPGEKPERIEPHAGLPAEVIIELDIRWLKLVVKLTSKWGLIQYLKAMPVLKEAKRLEGELRSDGPVREAYLRSDLKFFDALFEPFPFKYQTQQQIKDWLAMANQ